MKNIFFFFSFLLLVGCNSTLPLASNHAVVNPYFVGGGEEPFWGIEISEEKVVFTSLVLGYEKIVFSHAEPTRAMDANIKTYDFKNNDAKITVSIFQRDCTNSMSGAISSYKVIVAIKLPSKAKAQTFEGCGSYKADYRLTDIWVLEQLKGKTVTTDDFARELPNMEIDSERATFNGYSGCNRMAGKIFSEREILRFTSIVSTEMACIDRNRELEFLQALQSCVNYKIENNRLSLSNSYGTQLVFRKVD